MNSILGQLGKEEGESVTDETILNVIRRKDEKVLKTAEISEELTISQNWTGKRLNELESQERVHSKSAGQGRVWWLDESEPAFPVAEGFRDLIWYSSAAKRASSTLLLTGLGMFTLGGVLVLVILLLGVFPSLSVLPFTSQNLATTAMYAALGASLLLVVGGGLRLSSIWIRRRLSTE